jgi:hypothetical protein
VRRLTLGNTFTSDAFASCWIWNVRHNFAPDPEYREPIRPELVTAWVTPFLGGEIPATVKNFPVPFRKELLDKPLR